MITEDDFKPGRPRGRASFSNEEYKRNLDRVFDSYDKDHRFQEILDTMKSYKFIYNIDKFHVFGTMLGFRNTTDNFLFNLEYPYYNAYNQCNLKVYLDTSLNYSYMDPDKKIDVEFSQRGKIKNYGHPITYIRISNDVLFMQNIISYIVSQLCRWLPTPHPV